MIYTHNIQKKLYNLLLSRAQSASQPANAADSASGKYEDIKNFDSIHTADIEFSCLYRGKFIKRYHNRTKQQLVILGNKWRERVATEHPDPQIWIVVHYDDEDGWFLDTFNWNVTEIWSIIPEHTIWL